eukprot:3463771-Pyramimonas_sp.AAC.2
MAGASKVFFASSSQYYHSEYSIVDIVTAETKYTSSTFHDDQGTVSAFAGTAVPAARGILPLPIRYETCYESPQRTRVFMQIEPGR